MTIPSCTTNNRQHRRRLPQFLPLNHDNNNNNNINNNSNNNNNIYTTTTTTTNTAMFNPSSPYTTSPSSSSPQQQQQQQQPFQFNFDFFSMPFDPTIQQSISDSSTVCCKPLSPGQQNLYSMQRKQYLEQIGESSPKRWIEGLSQM